MERNALRLPLVTALAAVTFGALAAFGGFEHAGVGSASAAQYPQTDLWISRQADFINQGQIIVYVAVRGTGGTGFVNVNVQQTRPPLPPVSGFGGTQVICDGQRRTYAVTVFTGFFPGWQLGEAAASASAFCPTSGSDFDTQSIRISKP